MGGIKKDRSSSEVTNEAYEGLLKKGMDPGILDLSPEKTASLKLNTPPQSDTENAPSPNENSKPFKRRTGRRAEDRLNTFLTKPLFKNIFSGISAKDIMYNLTQDLKELFSCEAVSLFGVNREKRLLYSCNYEAEGIEQIVLEISTRNLPGFVAATGTSLNISDVYDKDELSKIHPNLSHDNSFDKKFNFSTKSSLVFPLPCDKRLMGVVELVNKKMGECFTSDDKFLAKEISLALGQIMVKLDLENIEEKIQALYHSKDLANTLEEFLLDLPVPLMHFFGANWVTIYGVDPERNEIYSKMKTGNAVREIRVPIAAKSIAGFTAFKKQVVNIVDVYDEAELAKHHHELRFDSSWDKKSGLRTKTMLSVPILHSENLLGVLQLVNKNFGDRFTEFDEKNAQSIADKLSLAFSAAGKSMQEKPTPFGYLVRKGLISQESLEKALTTSLEQNRDIEGILLNEYNILRQDLGKSLSLFYNIPYLSYSNTFKLSNELLTGLNKNYLIKHGWMPLQRTGNTVSILINNPGDADKIRNISMIFKKRDVEFRVGLKADIRDFLSSGMIGAEQDQVESKIREMKDLISALGQGKEVVEDLHEDDIEIFSESDSTVVGAVNKILVDAYDQGASDIHIEPGAGQNDITIRFRRDGKCLVYLKIPSAFKQAIISRIKIMSNLDISEKRHPQDGKIQIRYGKRILEYRVAVIPSVGGNEDAVLRLLAAKDPTPLDNLSLSERNLNLIKAKVQKPHGLILVVGPTGSGKTTTLHSCLHHINTPEKKIWTVEDPVEITQDGLRQIQVNKKIGVDFAAILRSLLRADPNVIMVGEMRDRETCKISMEAALTGHVVFSTLHTNSAPETIVRLLDMGMDPLLFADTLLLIVSQRLVGKLCTNCAKPYHPSKEEFNILVKEYGEEDFQKLGIKYDNDLLLKQPIGCVMCSDTGYIGRAAIYEVLEATPSIKKLIIKGALMDEIREQARQDGMDTVKQDGIKKVFAGLTDLHQVKAVADTE